MWSSATCAEAERPAAAPSRDALQRRSVGDQRASLSLTPSPHNQHLQLVANCFSQTGSVFSFSLPPGT